MWFPKTIELFDLFSHQRSFYQFVNSTALVVGNNLDDTDSQESNGSGKSALIEAVIIALTGASLRKVPAVEMIRFGQQTASVEFKLFNSLTNTEMLIIRTFHASKSKAATVHVFLNDEPQSQLTSVNEANKFILEQIGIGKDDLTNYFVISKEKYQSFIYASDTQKKEIINRFSNAGMVDKVEEKLAAEVKSLDFQLRDLTGEILRTEGKLSAYQQQLRTAEGQNQPLDKSAEQQRLETLLASEPERTQKYHDALTLATEAVAVAQREKNQFKIPDTTDAGALIGEQFTLLAKDRTTALNGRKEREGRRALLDRVLLQTVECPHCLESFSLADHSLSIQQAQQELADVVGSIAGFDVQLAALDAKGENLREEKAALVSAHNAAVGEHHRLTMQLNRAEQALGEVQAGGQKLRTAFENYRRQLDALQAPQRLVDTAPILAAIEQQNVALRGLTGRKSSYEADKADKEMWLVYFKRFKTYLANQSVKSIEGYTNLFLQSINSNLQVEMSGFKEMSSGKVKEQIDINVVKNGATRRSFGSYSSGEKARVDMCTILAMQALINLNTPTGGLNLLIADEIIESLDGKGLRNILHSLNNLNKTIWLVTHGNLEMVVENRLLIEKQGGISRILTT
jgi:DNA repair exonuclease SbcCD ATPase subunit